MAYATEDKGIEKESISRYVAINIKNGLHLRPSEKILNITSKYKGSLEVYNPRTDEYQDAKSMLTFMVLGAGRGSMVEFRATGYGASKVLDAIESRLEELAAEDEEEAA